LKQQDERLHVRLNVVVNYGLQYFPINQVTARAAESRMGSGKGSVDYWVAVIKPGTIMFELAGVPLDVATKAMRLAAYKLPVKTNFITKENI